MSSSQRVQRGVNVAIIGVGFTLMLHFLYQAATSICRGLRNGLDAGIYLLAITLQNSIIPSDRTTHQPPPTPTPPRHPGTDTEVPRSGQRSPSLS